MALNHFLYDLDHFDTRQWNNKDKVMAFLGVPVYAYGGEATLTFDGVCAVTRFKDLSRLGGESW
jgi:hypothetical protein